MTRQVLVVDDTPKNVKLLADVLEAKGYATITRVVRRGGACQGRERGAGPRPARRGDARHERLRGLPAIRANPAHRMLPVVMVTALDPAQERIKGLEAGADDFLTKPINQAELLARVRVAAADQDLYDSVDEPARRARRSTATLEERVATAGRAARAARPAEALLLCRTWPSSIVAGGADDPLKTHRREITVVFLDLRGFTAFAETAEPEEVMGVLREYHAAMGRLILEHEGTLERFTGDGMMIFFNDPVPVPDPAERAVRMALAMRDGVARADGAGGSAATTSAFGVGIAQGYATLGAIGFEGRLDYGAIGTVTNLAARLCGEARGGETLVSQRLIASPRRRVRPRAGACIGAKGLSAPPVPAFRLLGTRRGRLQRIVVLDDRLTNLRPRQVRQIMLLTSWQICPSASGDWWPYDTSKQALA